ncbi:MAG: hypothetical protein OXN44_06025 [Acidimicrobiaceae bacterium]|nr:hypothetical protein [Acidimicrobiaceae bacterium]
MLVSAALVMFMAPGLALFYGGMVGTRNVLNMNLYCLGVVPLLWALHAETAYNSQDPHRRFGLAYPTAPRWGRFRYG